MHPSLPPVPVSSAPCFTLESGDDGVFDLLLGVALGEEFPYLLHGNFEVLPLIWLWLGQNLKNTIHVQYLSLGLTVQFFGLRE